MKRLATFLGSVAASLLVPSLIFAAAITADDQRSTTGLNVTTLSITNHVSSSNANRIIVIGVNCGYSSTPNVSGVTVDTVAATNISNFIDTNNRNSLWYFLAATPGTNTITATYSANCQYAQMYAKSFYNVDQTTPIGTPPTPTAGISTTPSITVSSPASTDVVIDNLQALGNLTSEMTAGADQTAGPCNNNIRSSGHSACISVQPGSAADGGVMSWTLAHSNNWTQTAIAIHEAAAGGAPTLFFNRRRTQ